jgi:ATP-binding cassette subfamily F protein 2
MPSDAKKREQQRKKGAAKARQAGKKNPSKADEQNSSQNGDSTSQNGSIELSAEEALCAKLEADARLNAEARACTGSLAVHPKSRDIKIANFSINKAVPPG